MMRKFVNYLLGLFEDSKESVTLLPLIIGTILLIFEETISISFSAAGTNMQKIIRPFLITIAFFLWGVQGLIFAKRKEFLIFIIPVKGKTAVVLGSIVAVFCFFLTIRNLLYILSLM